MTRLLLGHNRYLALLILAHEMAPVHLVKINKADLGPKIFKDKDKAQWKRETRGRRLK